MQQLTGQHKVKSLESAVAMIKDGDMIAIGGVLTAREPTAIIREIIRQGKKSLHAIGGAHGYSVDLMCAAGVLAVVENSYVGYEFDLGLSQNYRRACEEKRIAVKDTDCNILLRQLQATEQGIPFMPMPKIDGTDLLDFHPEIQSMKCPFTGKEVSLVPAIKPDVAIIHAHYADRRGNIKIEGPLFKDRLFAITADRVIVSVEKIVLEEEMKKMEPTIPYYCVSAIVEVAQGAHPLSCYPFYAYDRKHLQEFIACSKDKDTLAHYLGQYIYGVHTQGQYLNLVGGNQRLNQLSSWNVSTNQWMEVFK
jgi:glutaconate CoA-transferase subunit A